MIVRLQSPRTGRYSAPREALEIEVEHCGRVYSIVPRWELGEDGKPVAAGLSVFEMDPGTRFPRVKGPAAACRCPIRLPVASKPGSPESRVCATCGGPIG